MQLHTNQIYETCLWPQEEIEELLPGIFQGDYLSSRWQTNKKILKWEKTAFKSCLGLSWFLKLLYPMGLGNNLGISLSEINMPNCVLVLLRTEIKQWKVMKGISANHRRGKKQDVLHLFSPKTIVLQLCDISVPIKDMSYQRVSFTFCCFARLSIIFL